MKKKAVFIVVIVAILIIITMISINNNEKTKNKIEDEYTITSYDGTFKVSKKMCANLEKEDIQKIEDKLFFVNHNIVNTFKDTSEFTIKDYQMTVWFKKLKLDKKKTCTSEEFEQIIKDTYNVNFKEHQSLENTLEYSKRNV